MIGQPRRRPAPGVARIAEVETALAVTLPDPVRGLYRESDGWFVSDGQWYVVWPLARVLDDNRTAWRRGLPQHLLAFGDDGAGNPFCVDLDERRDAVVRWSWIDRDVDGDVGSMADFRSTWISGAEDTP